MNININITLENGDGKEIKLSSPESIRSCDIGKKIYLCFDNFKIYSGYLDDIDFDEICLKSKESGMICGFPYDRLIGWFTEENISKL